MVNQPEDSFPRDQEKVPISYVESTLSSSTLNQESIVVDNADVRPNDHKVLEILSEDNSNYTFKGLMRKLGMHQESLSRSLHRLDELGLVKKLEMGYILSKKGELVARRSVAQTRTSYTPLMQTYIPPNIDVSTIVSGLAGRWFKNLRWLGTVEGEMGHMLQWASENNTFQVNFKIVGNCVIIETNAGNDKDRVVAIVSAYRIFEYVSKLYTNQYGSVSTFTMFGNTKEPN